MQPPYPPESTLDLETSFSPSQEVNSSSSPAHSLHHPHHHYHNYYPMPSPPFSPSSFNYDFLFSADALPPLPPPGLDPEAGDELATVPPPPAASTRQASGSRRRYRTDRHSKIHTSQGLRDRRMRLSLGVARHFFQLQDMLGFDKASHTIDWLLKQSKSAIDLLARSPASFSKEVTSGGNLVAAESSASECEVVSGDSNRSKVKPAKAKGAARPAKELLAVDARFKRESRAKARARARERTIEKRRRIKGEESVTCGLMGRFVTSEFSNEADGCCQMGMISTWFSHSNEEAGSCKGNKGGGARNVGRTCLS